MSALKRFYKQHTHNLVFKAIAGFGRNINRMYENVNYDIRSNGELRLIKKLARLSPKIIIDGGANVGEYALAIAQNCPDTRVYAFEPVGPTFEKLVKHTADYQQIQAIQKGLFKAEGSTTINYTTEHSLSSLYQMDDDQTHYEKMSINLIKGDEFLKEQKISQVDFLKLDIEGAELDALEGFVAAFSKGQIRAIQFEYGYINIVAKKLLYDFYQFFERYGYTVGKIYPSGVDFRDYRFKDEDFLGPNYVAVSKEDEELLGLLA